MHYALSVLIGSLIAVMIFLNGKLASSLGAMHSNLIAHASGLVLSVLAMIGLKSWRPIPKKFSPLWLSGGAVGFLAVFFANRAYADLGVSTTVGLGLFGQALSSLAVDHFGLFGSPIRKFRTSDAVGLAAVLAGILVMSPA